MINTNVYLMYLRFWRSSLWKKNSLSPINTTRTSELESGDCIGKCMIQCKNVNGVKSVSQKKELYLN